jgi:hypothetical protein
MYALFVLSVHVYYVNCNAKTQMGYLCALIKKKIKLKKDKNEVLFCRFNFQPDPDHLVMKKLGVVMKAVNGIKLLVQLRQ